jgi:hypothetical protein
MRPGHTAKQARREKALYRLIKWSNHPTVPFTLPERDRMAAEIQTLRRHLNRMEG